MFTGIVTDVGEIRRRKEAEVMLEAMHTGHSVYATVHANNADETVMRLTNPPIDIPKQMLSALSLILVQNRNRLTGKRRTLQVAELTPEGEARVLLRYNAQKDKIEKIAESKMVMDRLELYTGMKRDEIEFDIHQKIRILKWLVKTDVANVNDIGLYVAKYYTGNLVLK